MLNYQQDLEELKDLGFETPKYIISKVLNAKSILTQFEEDRDDLDYDIDGVVARLNNHHEYLNCGLNGSKTKPRGAFAMKFATVGHITEILAIEWSSEGGEYVCPVAILSPVIMDKSEVSRARIKAVDVYSGEVGVGSMVELHMAGEIIPHIKSILTKPDTTEETPKSCEHCDTALLRANTGLTCNNPDCSNKQAHAIMKFLKTLRIKGCGMEVARQAAQEGLTINNLYKKEVSPLTQRFSKNWEKVMTQIMESKNNPLQKMLEASPISGFGKGSSIKVSDYAKTIKGVYELRSATQETLKTVGLTAGNQESFQEFLHTDMFDNFDLWIDEGHVEVEKEKLSIDFDLPKIELSGTVIVMTGSPQGYHKVELTECLESLGAIVKSSITKSTDLLFSSSTTSSKAKKAKSWGIEVIDYPIKLS